MPKKSQVSAIPKLGLSSPNPAEETIEGLRLLLPGAFGEDGKLDWQKLHQLLGDFSSDAKERYSLSWAGKREAIQAVQRPGTGALVPMPEESIDWATTENVIIEGDNLEVLKLMQKAYHSQVKMIYIDPPYNTGNDFIYPDNFREGLQTYLEYSGQAKRKISQTQENENRSGRKHSAWLSMMYPRLFLARNLLRDDGVIFVSIDDHEVHNLRLLLNEIFGEENFVAEFVWQKRYSRDNRPIVGAVHDYILCFARELGSFEHVRRKQSPGEEQLAVYRNPNSDPRGRWRPIPMTAQGYRKNQMYEITAPGGKVHRPPTGRCWGMVESEFLKLKDAGRIWFGADGNSQPNVIRYLDEVEGMVPWTWIPSEEGGHTDQAKKELYDVLEKSQELEKFTPKPSKLLRHLMEIALEPETEQLVVDFFAGSATTAHATFDLNREDGGNRRFLLVQLPEPLDETLSLSDGTEFRTIADVARARARRVGSKLGSAAQKRLSHGRTQEDLGFRAFKLTGSHFLPWDDDTGGDAEKLSEKIRKHTQGVLEKADPQGILFEILLKSGYPLSVGVKTVDIAGQSVYEVDEGKLLVNLNMKLEEPVLRAMIDRGPEKIVLLDDGFQGNDSLKANIAQQVKQHNALHPDRWIDLRTV